MSKRHKHRKQQTQPALIQSAKSSVAQIVLQRMSQFSGINQPEVQIKLVAEPAGSGMPTVIRQTEATIPPPVSEWPKNWPPCPPTCDQSEWRRSLENKEYYELKYIEDDGRKPWFQYPKYTYQYSEFVYCTPEMMTELLEHMPINRPFKEQWADTIARDVINERWLQTHESIAINKLGNMHDGQHRAKGIIKAGRGWPIYVTWNVPPEAIYVTDSGDKRKVNEKLSLLFPESKLTHKSAALCRAMMWGINGRSIRYSESEIADFAVKHHNIIVWLAVNMRGFRADIQAVIGKAILWWGEEVISPFVQRLKTIQFGEEGDPARALYLWILKAKQEGRRAGHANPTIYYRKALSAIYAHAEGRTAAKLYQKMDDIFEWNPGWEIPQIYKGIERPLQGDPFMTPPEEEKMNNDPDEE